MTSSRKIDLVFGPQNVDLKPDPASYLMTAYADIGPSRNRSARLEAQSRSIGPSKSKELSETSPTRNLSGAHQAEARYDIVRHFLCWVNVREL